MNKNFEPIFEHLEEILGLSSIETSAGVGIALANHVTDLLDYMSCSLKNPIKAVQDPHDIRRFRVAHQQDSINED